MGIHCLWIERNDRNVKVGKTCMIEKFKGKHNRHAIQIECAFNCLIYVPGQQYRYKFLFPISSSKYGSRNQIVL